MWRDCAASMRGPDYAQMIAGKLVKVIVIAIAVLIGMGPMNKLTRVGRRGVGGKGRGVLKSNNWG